MHECHNQTRPWIIINHAAVKILPSITKSSSKASGSAFGITRLSGQASLKSRQINNDWRTAKHWSRGSVTAKLNPCASDRPVRHFSAVGYRVHCGSRVVGPSADAAPQPAQAPACASLYLCITYADIYHTWHAAFHLGRCRAGRGPHSEAKSLWYAQQLRISIPPLHHFSAMSFFTMRGVMHKRAYAVFSLLIVDGSFIITVQ